MPKTKTTLLILLGLLALLGAAIAALASFGDAAVVASTAGIYHVLEGAGAQDNIALRDGLYEVVLRLKAPWSIVQYTGFAVLFVAAAAIVSVWRSR